MKDKNHMFASLDAERAVDKIKIFHDKNWKIEYRRNFLNKIKVIHDKPTTNFILNGEKSKNFPLKSEEGWPLSPFYSA